MNEFRPDWRLLILRGEEAGKKVKLREGLRICLGCFEYQCLDCETGPAASWIADVSLAAGVPVLRVHKDGEVACQGKELLRGETMPLECHDLIAVGYFSMILIDQNQSLEMTMFERLVKVCKKP